MAGLMQNIIEVKGIKKQFKTYESTGSGFLSLRRKWYYKQALRGVSFSIGKGEIVALLGKNGSGKSTLIKTICGILHSDEGAIDVLGFRPWEDRVRMVKHLGVVLGAHSQLIWDLPAIDSFRLMRHVYKIPKSEFEKRLRYYIKLLELEDVYKRQVRTLSLGEQMKCNFVASVLHAPEFVILDEPTIGVDLPSKQALKEAILGLNKNSGVTFIITTHMIEDLMMAERILVLDRGKVIFDGPRHRLETFFGDERILNIKFIEDPDYKAYSRYGIVLQRGENYLKMKVRPSVLTDKGFTSMLSRKNVVDYSVSEQELGATIMRLYATRGKKTAGR
jgi:ABC-2 type transport system ATP-binding protein